MINLKVGLVGLGVMGKNHLRILSKLEGVSLIGIVDPSYTNESPRSENIFLNLEELLNKKPDYCVVATPTGLHKEIASQILEAGINCLIEKPVAIDFESAISIKEIADRNSQVVGIGHIERYNSAVKQLRSRLLNGELGEIYQISTRRQGPFPSRIGDVGVVRDLGTHDIDLTMWLTDCGYKYISAQTLKRSTRAYEDMASVTGRLNNNVLINMIMNWMSPFKEREILVIGEKGAFSAETLTSNLTFYKNGNFQISQTSLAHFIGVSQGDIISYEFEKPEPLLLEHENFRDHLLGKKAEIITLDEGLKTTVISDAILKSASMGIGVVL
jgi:UDP-N-acetylglucosamine 3-dehydrogenase